MGFFGGSNYGYGGYDNCGYGYGPVESYGQKCQGNGFALIVVLFILLIIIGASLCR